MNYEKNYYDYIAYVKSLGNRHLSYSETHHIKPRCMGGDDSEDNLVVLTAREHFLAHYLLVKMNPDNHKLLFAFMGMGMGIKKNCNRYMNSRLYEKYRLKAVEVRSKKVMCVETGEIFPSATYVEKNVKNCKGVRDVIYGNSLTAGGYHWKYVDEEHPVKQPFQRKKVICANTGKIYNNVDEAGKDLGVKSGLIRSLCNGCKTGGAKGMTVYYYEGEDKEYPIKHFETHQTKKVRCIETGDEFNSILEAADGDKKLACGICACCKGKRKVCKGKHWEYVEEHHTLDDYKDVQKRKVVCVETKIIYNSLKEAADTNNILSTNILSCCKNTRRTCGGYHWMYLEDYNADVKIKPHARKSRVMCVETGKTYSSIREAANLDKKVASAISDCCRGLKNDVNGQHWKYADDSKKISSKKKKVMCVETGKYYESISEAARENNQGRNKITMCCLGAIENLNGLHYKFI